MLAAPDISPPAAAPTLVVIDERWSAPPAPSLKAAMVDPRIREAAAAAVAEAPARDPAPNRQSGLQPSAYGADAAAKFAKGFSDAKVQPCLSPSTGGLGLFAIPVIAIQALRGKCLMP